MVHLHGFLHRRVRRQGGGAWNDWRQGINDFIGGNPGGGPGFGGGGGPDGSIGGPFGRAGPPSNPEPDQGVATLVSVVYVTMPASFTGPTAGFVTQTATDPDPEPSPNPRPVTTPQTTTTSKTRDNTDDFPPRSSPTSQTPSRQPPKQSSVSSTSSTTTTTTTTTPPHTSNPTTAAAGTPVQAGRTSAAAAPAATTGSTEQISQAPDGGMSGGAKAGIAFGIIFACALVAGLVFLLVKRKKQQKEEHAESHDLDNEKAAFASAGAFNNTPRNDTVPTRAPRLSLRPVTQFLPTIGEPKVTEMTNANGGVNSFLPPAPPVQQHKSAWERPSNANSNSSTDPANPFGAHAERIDNHATDRQAENAPIPVPAPASTAAAPTDPFADKPADPRAVSPLDDPPAVTAPSSPTRPGIASAVAVGAAASGAAAVGAAAASTSPKGASNVHRVQLDFKPSMEDELALRAGQVVRMLHEYDDGWALCSYMDRSRQGVAPRTCLSKLPLKPRPQGPPPPGMRPMGSPGMRNFSGPPGPGQRNMFPAPLSPSMPNMHMPMPRGPNSPPQGNRMRSHSTTNSMDNGNRPSPQMMSSVGFGASPPKNHRRSASVGQLALGSPNRLPLRKPVPGQAI